MNHSEKGFFSILGGLIILITVVGIVAGVYLSQQKQDLKSKANTSEITPINNEGKFGSTPFDPLLYPKHPNGISAMTFYPFGEDGLLSKRFDYAAKQLDYTWFEIGSMLGDSEARYQIDLQQNYFPNLFSQDPLINAVKTLKTQNPNMKVGIHAGGIVTQNSWFVLYNYLDESDFLHYKNGQPIWLGQDPNIPKYKWQRFVNIYSAATRVKIINAFRTIYASTDRRIDGFLLDGYISWAPYMPADGCLEGDCKNYCFWINNMVTLTQEIKAGLPSEVELYYNGFSQGNSDPFNIYKAGFGQYTDGALMEHPHAIITSPAIFKEYMDGAKKLIDANKQSFSANKKILFWVQLQILNHMLGQAQCLNPGDPNSCDPSGVCLTYWITSTCRDYFALHNRPNDNNLQRFFLASYLLIQEKGKTYYGYQPAGPLDPGVLFFYKDWNMDFGVAQDINRQDAAGLYFRHYTYGLAVVNPTDQVLTFNFPDNLTYYDWELTGTPIKGSVVVPPKTGHFYLKSERLPSPSPILSLSPSPSPTPSPRQKADIDNNGAVDISDFTQVVSDFGETGTNLISDIEKSGSSLNKVDISDYNLVVSNFGK